MRHLSIHLPPWLQDWLELLVPALQILLILFAAWLINLFFKRVTHRAGTHYALPRELMVPLQGVIRWLIIAATVLLILERLGVSATVLWTAFTGFATVGAVAFFAAWSVLSNLFCTLLIVVIGPYRLGDYIELIDIAEKTGPKGRVVDINMLYTTLEDASPEHREGTLLQIPNALIFQRVVRRWKGGIHARMPDNAPPTAAEEAAAQRLATGSKPQ
ncbi:mechanosensitive ion channel family protein [Comamonas endophytica]|uniref:Small-conductance mechanosensitive channel n=1 Tax=Comamonas endophytica TaxID=2949090 RepID=A0ABY6GBN3_9BURK|nr:MULTISPECIES: mechanosensitive ion channel family protein [unclassified Acidovorax]MCD2513524.1 mechanosensitive ion channel family protein [Acidovorax sp. D4N7]UYG52464.1 mechanosensitive ion channel family protein [Acidovorax sp. 5MLIR]